MTDPPSLGSGANRLEWSELPDQVRWSMEGFFGSSVVVARTQPGGFSPGLAARLVLADGRRFFVKAVGSGPGPPGREVPADAERQHTAQLVRREARVVANLPAAAPVPELIWSYDDGDWVALVLSDVAGRTPVEPWRPAELDRVLAALPGLWGALTPAPYRAPTVAATWADDFGSWSRLALLRAPALKAAAPWAYANLDRLADVAAGWGAAVAGETLLHGDLRADNVMLPDDGGVVFVDWPHAVIGAPWVDLVLLLPSVAAQGYDPEALFVAHPASRGVDAAAVTAVVAALAGASLARSLGPPPPGGPVARESQLAQGRAALAWLRQRIQD